MGSLVLGFFLGGRVLLVFLFVLLCFFLNVKKPKELSILQSIKIS